MLAAETPAEAPVQAAQWMTVAEVAKALRIPLSTTYELVRQGAIPSVKIGRHRRVRRDYLDALGR